MKLSKPEKVKLLLLTLDEGLELAPMAARGPRFYEMAQPGAQASSWVRCDVCKGCGRVVGADVPCMRCLTALRARRPIRRPQHGCRMCLLCDGRGEHKRRHSDPRYDAYSGLTMEELEQKRSQDFTQEAPRKALSAPLAASDDQGGLLTGSKWERARERVRNGSFLDLRRQLEWLREEHYWSYSLLMHWLSTQDDPIWVWPESVVERVEATIRLLAERMPDPIVLPAWVWARARGKAA